MNALRKLIKELITQELRPQTALHKMMPEALLDMLDDLDQKLAAGIISKKKYDFEHNDILKAAGWTQQEYEDLVDSRWGYIDDMRAVPDYDRSKNN